VHPSWALMCVELANGGARVIATNAPTCVVVQRFNNSNIFSMFFKYLQ
jgi:hypothetical protein